MRRNADFCTFIGLVDRVRETSLIFPVGSALGLTLRGVPDGVEVSGVKSDCPAPGAAVALRVGDRISKVGGEDVLGAQFDLVVAKLKAAPRPLCVHFIGEAPVGVAMSFDAPGTTRASHTPNVGFATSSGGMSADPPVSRQPLPLHPHEAMRLAAAAAAAGSAGTVAPLPGIL